MNYDFKVLLKVNMNNKIEDWQIECELYEKKIFLIIKRLNLIS